MHVGNARTAIFNWLFARHQGDRGKFILRVEDTDRERHNDEAVQVILDGLKWLGLDWDEGPIFQSERLEMYQQAAHQLLESGHAYHCYCTAEELKQRREAAPGGNREGYDGRCRARTEPRPGVEPTIRLRTPDDGVTEFEDQIQGRITVPNTEIDDRVILRSNGMPTYNLSVVVDDHDMQITHVIRGADHLTNTPVQVLLYRAFGWEAPSFSHLPLILGPDRKKLSKRHGAVKVTDYHEQGVLPEALFNALIRLGWSHGDQEIFTKEELIRLFTLEGCNRSPSIFDFEKLRNTVQRHDGGFWVLPQPPEDLDSVSMTIEEAHDLLALLMRSFTDIVVDMGSALGETSRKAVLAAETVVLVTTQEVPPLRKAARRLAILRELGVPAGQVHLVVNRYQARRYPKVDEIAQQLHHPVIATISNDYATVNEALHAGATVFEASPRSAVAQDLQVLKARLLGEEAPRPRKGWFGSK